MWLRSDRAGAMLGIADRLDLERGGRRGVPPDVRLARARGAPRRLRSRRSASCGHARTDRRLGSWSAPTSASRGKVDPISPERVGGAGAHAGLGIPERADQRRDRADLVQPTQDQRRVDPHLVRGIARQRLLDVLDLHLARCGPRSRTGPGRTSAVPSSATDVRSAGRGRAVARHVQDHRSRTHRSIDFGHVYDAPPTCLLTRDHGGPWTRSDSTLRLQFDLARLFGGRRRCLHVSRAAQRRRSTRMG